MDSPEAKSWKFYERKHPDPVNTHLRKQHSNHMTDMLFSFYLNEKNDDVTALSQHLVLDRARSFWSGPLYLCVFARGIAIRGVHGSMWIIYHRYEFPVRAFLYWCTIDTANMTPSQWKPQPQHVKYTRTESIPMSRAAFNKVTLRKPYFFLFCEVDYFWNLQVRRPLWVGLSRLGISGDKCQKNNRNWRI